ncbi:phosphatidate cytidylyltransferase [Holzapfeliella sp. JNUCC 72]
MKIRVLTALVALAIALPLVYVGGIYLTIIMAVLSIIAMAEIYMMKKRVLVSVDLVLAALAAVSLTVFDQNLPMDRYRVFLLLMVLLLGLTIIDSNRFNFEDVGVIAITSLYVGQGFHYFLQARASEKGLALVGLLLVIIWITDSGAYLVGRTIGKHPLYKPISPNKTIEGSVGGVVVAILASLLYTSLVPLNMSWVQVIIISGLLSIVGQIGDLVESAYKRFYQVKDSGTILPGHGGILDRFDSLLFVLPVAYLIGLF